VTQSAPSVALQPVPLGAAPEGEHLLRAWSANAALETQTPPTMLLLRVDSGAPSQPGPLDAVVTRDVGVRLTWTASEDGGSGVSRYAVYRKAGSPPFAPTDVVAITTDLTYLDVPPAFTGTYTYAVSAFDVAGNESALSELALGFSDYTPPLAPTGLSAWRGLSGMVTVRWTPSADVGIGVHHYDVLRSVDGAAFASVGTAGRDDGQFVDADPVVATATDVRYEVVTVDRVGQRSSPVGPAAMAADTTRPTTAASIAGSYPVAASITLVPSDTGSGAVSTRWRLDGVDGSGTRVDTGVLGAHTLEYWSVDAAGNEELPHNSASFAVITSTPSAVWRFYNMRSGTHFYTASEDEMLRVRAGLSRIYRFEGAAYHVNTANPSNGTPLYRFYNMRNGAHFYTASESEMLAVRARLFRTYRFEGEAYRVCAVPAGATPVWRFYNARKGGHFYTASESEMQSVRERLSGTYRYEGPAYYLAP